jgi:hypothetical protein
LDGKKIGRELSKISSLEIAKNQGTNQRRRLTKKTIFQRENKSSVLQDTPYYRDQHYVKKQIPTFKR